MDVKAPASRGPILIVEDDQCTLEALRWTLEYGGFTVHAVTDGAEALNLAGEIGPSVILLDIHMPVMDGFSFLEAYSERALPPARVIVMSGSEAIAPDLDERFGSVEHLPKPFGVHSLLGLVRNQAAVATSPAA